MNIRTRHSLPFKIASLLTDVHKLGVCDWSTRDSEPYPESHLTDNELRRHVIAQTAVLSVLFQESEPSKIPLESYLWSKPIRTLLEELGLLQCGVVMADRHSPNQITRLEVDLPDRSLRMPVKHPLANVGPNKMTREIFDATWRQMTRRVTLFPELAPKDRATVLEPMQSWIYNYATAPNTPLAVTKLLSPLFASVARKLKEDLSDDLLTMMERALADHIAALVMSSHLISLNRSQRLKNRRSFVEFMYRERKDIATISSNNGVLWVPDGEISFLILEFLSTAENDVDVGGKVILKREDKGKLPQDVLEGVGLLPPETGLAKRMAEWVRDLLGVEGNDGDQHAVLCPLNGNPFWVELNMLYRRQSRPIEEVLTPLLNGRVSVEALHNFCDVLCKHRPQEEVEEEGPVNCKLALFQRWLDPTPRYILAFPLSGWRERRTVRRVAYFVGTVVPADAITLDQQILLVRTLVSAAVWPFMHNVLEEQLALERVSSFFVHDLIHNVFDLNNHIEELLSVITDEGLRGRANGVLTEAQALYGTARLIGDLQKAIGRELPEEWADPALIQAWPGNLERSHFHAIKDRCREAVLGTVAEYVPKMRDLKRHLRVREIDEKDKPMEEIDAMKLDAVELKVKRRLGSLPPFRSGDNDEGRRAILAPLVEIVRNAVKAVIRNDDSYFVFKKHGVVAIDFQIVEGPDYIRVEIWNPYRGAKDPLPSSLLRVQRLMFNNAVSTPLPQGDKKPPGRDHDSWQTWIRSEYRFFPNKIRFTRGDMDGT